MRAGPNIFTEQGPIGFKSGPAGGGGAPTASPIESATAASPPAMLSGTIASAIASLCLASFVLLNLQKYSQEGVTVLSVTLLHIAVFTKHFIDMC